MNSSIFDVTLHDISKYDWQQTINKAPRPPFYSFSSLFFARANSYAEQKDQTGERVFRFLGSVTSMAHNWDCPQRPFQARVIFTTGRSTDLVDFTHDDARVLVELVPITKDPELKARFADVACSLKFDHRLAKEAANAYLDAARMIADPEHWPPFYHNLRRAVQLAAKLGRNQDLFKTVIQEIETLIDRFSPSDTGFCCSKLLELLDDYGVATPERHSTIAASLAQRAEQNKKYHVARVHWDLAATLLHRKGDQDAARQMRLRSAETHTSEATAMLSSAKPSHLAASHHFALAVEAMRNAQASKERVHEVHRQLLEAQKSGMAEMQCFSTSVDISAIENEARQLVTGKDLWNAIYHFALGLPLSKADELKKFIEESADEFLFSSLISAAVVDNQGRVVGQRPSMRVSDPNAREAAVKAEMFYRASTVNWPYAVDAFIDPCRKQIWQEHGPTISDLAFLVQDNPIVPPGHHRTFLRGFQAGFSGDLQLATHFLIPQVESLIRHVLEARGIITSKLDSKRIQEVQTLGGLLDLPETIQIFTVDHVFALKGLLTEEFGSNLRNRLAHGLLNDADCFQPNVLYTWWLLLRLCFIPLAQIQESENMQQEEIDPASSV